ncbi:MAG: tetratricopeptide repeat protein [Vicinamibacterales bacterium]
MTPERWGRVESLFEHAAAQPAAERAAVVRAAADDEAMAALVLSMLQADARDAGELEQAVDEAIRAVATAASGPIDQRLGPYRIISEIGQGGMGTVYLGERADGAFEQRVAIKVVRGLLDQERVRRFRAERQILASLQHPNIARLVDGGTTGDGWPYLVMEYVEGRPIDAHARDQHLTLEERLRLFLVVCEAVGHAHRHLIVHRDIKPSNIIVTADGTPKLLDFGIAKLLDSDDPELSARTMTGMRMLTPDYASPEQVRGEPVTTATDVYALGVLLFELATGRRPHAFTTLSAREIERVVCDTDAPRPSTVVAGLHEDLDIIVGTALHKDRERRYRSVEALVDDVARFLEGRPIHARPATWAYRARRFVARHRWEVTVAGLFVLMLVAFSVLVSVQAARVARERDLAQQERDAAREVASFLVGIFEVSDPRESRGGTVTARELLDRGAARIEGGLASQPAVQGRLMDAIGRVYRQLGLFDQAESLLARALQLRESAGTGPDDVADTLAEMAEVAREKGNYTEGEALHRRALAMRRAQHGDTHDAVAFSLNGLGLALDQQGRYGESEEMLRTAIAMWRQVRPAGDPQVAVALNNLGQMLRRRARYTDAEPVLREALEIRRAAFGTAHPLLSNSLMQYGQLQNQLGHFGEAERYMREALEMRLQVYGPDHFIVGTSYNNLASLLHDTGQYDKAEPLYRASLEISRRVLGDEHPETAVTLNNLASLLEDRGDLAGAEAMFRDALAIRRKALGDGHPAVARGMHNLARVLVSRNRLAGAATLLSNSLAIKRETLGAEHLETATGIGLQAQVYARSGRAREALALSGQSVDMLRRVMPPNHLSIAAALLAHAQLLIDAGRAGDALPLAEEAVDIRRKHFPAGHDLVTRAEAVRGDAASRGQR